MSDQSTTYSSRVDAWIVLLLVVVLGGTLVAAALEAAESGDVRILIFAGIGVLFPCVLIGILSIPLAYRLDETILTIRSGLITWKVPIGGIREIRKTSNPLSAPAWSLKRIRIDYDNEGHPAWILISPQDRDAFISDLKARQAAFKSE